MALTTELEAARAGLAVGPVEAPAFLRVTGADARDFLHRMSTQDLAGLAPGASAYLAFLSAKGHLVAEGHAAVGEDGVLLVLDPAAAPALRAHLEGFVIADDVAFEDRSDALRRVPVLGPRAASAVESVPGPVVARVGNTRRGAPCVDLVVLAERAEAVREALLGDGAIALGAEALEALRILGGVARPGPDLEAARLPMEAGLARDAISFTKGCYLGQEIVVRATARGHLQRGLVVLALPPGAGPGTRLLADGQEVGVVTSAADSPEGRAGLGYLRRSHWAPGTRLSAGTGEAVVQRALVEDGG